MIHGIRDFLPRCGGKDNRVSVLQRFEILKMTGIVMSGNHKVVIRHRTCIPARSSPEVLVVPLCHDRQLQIQRGNIQQTQILCSVQLDSRYFLAVFFFVRICILFACIRWFRIFCIGILRNLMEQLLRDFLRFSAGTNAVPDILSRFSQRRGNQQNSD